MNDRVHRQSPAVSFLEEAQSIVIFGGFATIQFEQQVFVLNTDTDTVSELPLAEGNPLKNLRFTARQ